MLPFVDYKGELQDLAFVQYSFDRKEHSIDLQPHGNSKYKSSAFRRVKPSTVQMIKTEMSHTERPIKILEAVENKIGGVMQAQSSCDLPRDRRQVYNFKKAEKVKQEDSLMTSGISRNDTLAHIMNTCKQGSGVNAFIRSVEAAPEPMCLLATDQQLIDVERFCTDNESSVLSVDPTYNLGSFYVTPTTFRNLTVETRQHHHPVVLGPILVHQTKTFRPFHYFASTLIRLNPKLMNLKCFGTDGEPELIKAFNLCFPKAVHLRCVNHLRQNIKDKLRSLGILQSDCKEFISDIFGVQRGDHLEVGLIDAESEGKFYTALKRLKDKWNNLERSFVGEGSSPPQFYDWFLKYKVSSIITCVLPEVRKRAGMNGTCHFTTNTSESINNVIKQEVQWKENKLPVLIEHLKSIVVRQRSEVEKAVIGRGEWNFVSLYDSLKVADQQWFSMPQNAKELHMKKVYNCRLKTPVPSSVKSTCTLLSVPVDEVNLPGISESTLSGIWNKAESIVGSKSSCILEVPWIDDQKTKLVKSSSLPLPHLVSLDTKNQLYCCDSNCPMFKSFHLCSHVVAVAKINGDLEMFLRSLRKSTPNLTTIACEGLPSGSGRKGGQDKRRKRVKEVVVSRSVRPCLEEPNDFVSARTQPSVNIPTNTGVNPQPHINVPSSSTNGVNPQPHLNVPSNSTNGVNPQPHLNVRSSYTNGVNPQPCVNVPSSSTYAGVNPQPCVNVPSSSTNAGINPQPSVNVPSSSTYAGVNPQPRVNVPSSSTYAGVNPQPRSNLPCNFTDSFGANAQPPTNSCSSSLFQVPASSMSVSLGNSHGQVTVASGASLTIAPVINSVPSIPYPPIQCASAPAIGFPISSTTSTSMTGNTKPFVLKFLTKQIKVCQACRNNYEGANNTLGMVVARSERKLILNQSTGMQFWGKESNSHYHARLLCLQKVCPSFKSEHLVISEEVKSALSIFSKVLLAALHERQSY